MQRIYIGKYVWRTSKIFQMWTSEWPAASLTPLRMPCWSSWNAGRKTPPWGSWPVYVNHCTSWKLDPWRVLLARSRSRHSGCLMWIAAPLWLILPWSWRWFFTWSTKKHGHWVVKLADSTTTSSRTGTWIWKWNNLPASIWICRGY